MSTALSLPVKSMTVALLFFVLLFLPQMSFATPGDFFTFQRFAAAELRNSLGFSARSSKLAGRESASSTGHKVKRASLTTRNHSAALALSSNPKTKALRGVRKLLFGTLSCAPQDLSLTQGPVSSTSGIPTFNVQIVNLCGACAMADIHVACGNWASATPVDPFVFTRLGYNDCLVNNGQPLSSQGSVSFQYSNSAMYPMSIATATNECTR